MNTTLSMNSNTRRTTYQHLITIIVGLVVLLSLDILVRASLQDHTALGDPYYQDTILATQRAPVALVCSWLVVILSIVASLVRPKTKTDSASTNI